MASSTDYSVDYGYNPLLYGQSHGDNPKPFLSHTHIILFMGLLGAAEEITILGVC